MHKKIRTDFDEAGTDDRTAPDKCQAKLGLRPVPYRAAPQHRLNFLPLPQGHGSLRPALRAREAARRDSLARTQCITFAAGRPAASSFAIICM